jgi:hypothetical protein
MADNDKNRGFPSATERMDVTVDTLLKTVAAILATDQQHQVEFEEKCKLHNWVVTVDPDLINYVKDFLGEKPLPDFHTLTAEVVRRSPQGSCFPHRGGG